MAIYYADSSALVKRHLPESGSAWFTALASPAAGNVIVTARISLVEGYSALNRRVRKAAITLTDYQRVIVDLNHMWSSEYQIVELTPEVVDDARLLLERHPLRAYDVVQLASALQARRTISATGAADPVFLSADDRLLVAARVEGFITNNPNHH